MTKTPLALALGILLLTGCSGPANDGATSTAGAEETTVATDLNPLEQPWDGPFGEVPFDRLQPAHFPAAFDRAMALQKEAVAAIAASSEPPSLANTLEALERSGQPLQRVASAFGAYTASLSSDDVRAIQTEVNAKLSRHGTEILLDPALYQRVKAVHEGAAEAGLQGEALRLAERTRLRFERAGAGLDEAQRAEVSELTQRESQLMTQFGQNVLKDTEAYLLVLDKDDLDGLPEGIVQGAAATAAARGQAGKYAFTLQRPSVEDFLTHSTRRDLREQLFKAFIARGDNGNEFDNKTIIAELVEIRARRAAIMGFRSHADFITADSMIGSPEAALDLLRKVWTPALAQAGREREALQALAQRLGADHAIEGWDWRFYAEKLRQAEYDLDPAELQPYMTLDNVWAALGYVSGRLFGVKLVERPELPVYHPDVKVYEVTDAADRHIGLFYADYYARTGKLSGAWMASLRPQSELDGPVAPHVINNLNLTKPPEGQPTVLSMTEAETLFHEFGHALHGLLSQVRYPSLSGTAVPRDYVEFPAQFMEHYITQPSVLRQFARHAETGEPMPDALLERFIAASKFNQGFATVEFLASALVDQMYHSLTPEQAAGLDPAEFERRAMTELGAPEQIPMRHRSPHFNHIFAGGYSAGYYAYLWSEVLDADGFTAFKETGDIFDPASAARLREFVYSKGNTLDWTEAYQQFRGKAPSPEHLLRLRGLSSDD